MIIIVPLSIISSDSHQVAPSVNSECVSAGVGVGVRDELGKKADE